MEPTTIHDQLCDRGKEAFFTWLRQCPEGFSSFGNDPWQGFFATLTEEERTEIEDRFSLLRKWMSDYGL